MSVAKVIEISSTSDESFEDAIRSGITRASATLSGVTGAWVKEQTVRVEGGEPVEWRVTMKVTFLLEEAESGSRGSRGGSRGSRGGSRGERGGSRKR